MVNHPQIGKFDQRIVLGSYTEEPDSFGQPIETWVPFKTLWAKFKPLMGEERFYASALHSKRTAVFTVRYFPEMHEEMLILYQTLYWKITGVSEIGRRLWWDISAEVMK